MKQPSLYLGAYAAEDGNTYSSTFRKNIRVSTLEEFLPLRRCIVSQLNSMEEILSPKPTTRWGKFGDFIDRLDYPKVI